MRVIMNEVMNGENWPLNVWPLANRALEVICVEGEGDVVFTIGVLGPGEHDLGSATNRYTLIVDVGDAQLPDGRLVSAGEKVVFKRGEKVRLRCKEPVVCHAETI